MNNLLNPSYVTGFVDGEGTFTVLVLKRETYKTGWNIIPVFTITLHTRDTALLEKIQSFFGGVGKITIREKDNSAYYTVKSVKDIVNVIIPHFDKYPLLTQKQADFELFKKMVMIMHNKQHLKIEGLNKLIALKASLNNGLTTLLTKHFPDITPVKRPEVQKLFNSVNPFWVTGFTEAEGNFHVFAAKSSTHKTGYQIKLDFSVVQHSRDKILMENLVNCFNCGTAYKEKNREIVKFYASKSSDIHEKIIPFFQKYPFQGYKLLSYNKFCKVGELLKKKAHLTPEGINEILEIKQS